MANRKKVLFFVQESVGGAERMTVLIAKHLDLQKYDVKFVVVPYSQVSNSIHDFIPDNYEMIRINPASPIQKMFSMVNVLRKEKPDIVFSSVLHLSNKILPFRRFFPKTKFIIRCENYLFTFSRKQHLMIKMLYRLADSIIAQTREMKDELVQQMNIAEGKIVVLENPIDKEAIDEKSENVPSPYPDNGKKHFIASGRFCYQKGFDLLVRAFADAKRDMTNADLYIIGANDGEYKMECEKVLRMASDLGISDDVHCMGYQSNPYAYVKHADCFVLSSRWEGLPNVLIESLYLGTPVAAFKCIPIVERIVDDGKAGYLAEKEDVSSLGLAMVRAVGMSSVPFSYSGASIESFAALF